QGDVRFRPGRLQQCLEQVAAVQHDVGAAVTSPGVGEVEVGELLTADGVTEDESTRQDGQREDLLQHAHLVEHAGDVGSELQPRTDLGEVGRAFEDADPHPRRESIRAAPSPPIPPPAMITCSVDTWPPPRSGQQPRSSPVTQALTIAEDSKDDVPENAKALYSFSVQRNNDPYRIEAVDQIG